MPKSKIIQRLWDALQAMRHVRKEANRIRGGAERFGVDQKQHDCSDKRYDRQ